MYKQVLEEKIENLFQDISQKAYIKLNNPLGLTEASNQIVKMISSETTMKSKYMTIDLYSALEEKVLNSVGFQDISKQNAFFELNIREKIFDKYQFEISSLDTLTNGMNFKKINKVYTSIATAAGTAAVGGVLKYALYNTINIPVAVIIAGAVLVFCGMYFKAVPTINKQKFMKELKSFLDSVKKDFLAWFAEIEKYFNNCVEELKISF